MNKGMFTFYHADRSNSLSPNSTLLLTNSLSVFGEYYTRQIRSGDINKIIDPAVQREILVEETRRQAFPSRPSRFSCLFGANTPNEAVTFAKSIIPAPSYPIKIYEVRATRFFVCDMNWLDYIVGTNNSDEKLKYASRYWHPSITQHAPESTDRRPPRLEVLLSLPVEVGSAVSITNMEEAPYPEPARSILGNA